MSSRLRRAALALGLTTLAATVVVPISDAAAPAAPAAPATTAPKPSIVLVHGAWADASSWNAVITILQHDGYPVYAPPNPLRGDGYDAATVADFVNSIPGPVVLVGHSYGGFVITNAANSTPNVKALVYDDAYIPAKGQTVFQLNAAQPGSCVVADDPTSFLKLVPYPGATNGDLDAYLKLAPDGSYPGFNKCFANGVAPATAALLAAGQRPFAVSAGSVASGPPAWAHLPSWAIVGTADHVIPPAELLAMAYRARAHVVQTHAGHLSLITQAPLVVRTIEKAAASVQ